MLDAMSKSRIKAEIRRFEKAFNCAGFLEVKRTKTKNLCFLRIFYEAVTLLGYSPYDIEAVGNKSFTSVYYHLGNVSPIESKIAREFNIDTNYKYDGILGTYE